MLRVSECESVFEVQVTDCNQPLKLGCYLKLFKVKLLHDMLQWSSRLPRPATTLVSKRPMGYTGMTYKAATQPLLCTSLEPDIVDLSTALCGRAALCLRHTVFTVENICVFDAQLVDWRTHWYSCSGGIHTQVAPPSCYLYTDWIG